MRKPWARTANFPRALIIIILASPSSQAAADESHTPDYRWAQRRIVAAAMCRTSSSTSPNRVSSIARTDIGGPIDGIPTRPLGCRCSIGWVPTSGV